MLRMTLRAGVYTDNCVPFACPCNPVHVACCAALRRDWHEAPVRCDAPSRSLSDVKRTWRAHRERVDATRLTHMYGPAVRCKRTFVELADVRSCINVSGL